MRGHAGKSILALAQHDHVAVLVLIYDSRGARDIRRPGRHSKPDLLSYLLVAGRDIWLRAVMRVLDRHKLPRQEPESGGEKNNCTSVYSARIQTNPGEHSVNNLSSGSIYPCRMPHAECRMNFTKLPTDQIIGSVGRLAISMDIRHGTFDI